MYRHIYLYMYSLFTLFTVAIQMKKKQQTYQIDICLTVPILEGEAKRQQINTLISVSATTPANIKCALTL